MPKIINMDGKNYTFNPGKNGSLTARSKQYPSVSDVVNMPRAQAKYATPMNQVRQRRRNLVPAMVGSMRG